MSSNQESRRTYLESHNTSVKLPSYFVHLYIAFRIWLSIKFFQQLRPPSTNSSKIRKVTSRTSLINLGFGQYLKTTSTVSEIQVLRLLRAKTTVPVPQVIGAWRNPESKAKGCCWLLMGRIPGVTLEKAWPTLKKSQRRKLARQLARHLRQMRKLPQPPELAGAVTSFTGDVLDDPGLNPVWYKGRDIFSSTEDFVNELLDPIERDIGKFCEDSIDYKALLIEQKNLKLFLTHGDLAMRNIIVDPVATEVKGIIDWTTAAFLPRYWEAYKAIWSENKVNRQKRRFVQDAFGAFPEEQAVLMRREAAIAGKCEERSLLARRET